MTVDTGGPIETIVEIGAAGGSMTLEGRRPVDGLWQFRLVTNEAALYELLGEEPPPEEEAPWVSSWDAALELLGPYPWPRLHPLAVHPEFRDAVLAAVAGHEKGGSDQVDRWSQILVR